MLRSPVSLILLLTILSRPTAGQDLYLVDSLVTILGTSLHDSSRCQIMFRIAEESIRTDTLMAREFLEGGRKVALRMNDLGLLGQYHNLVGRMYRGNGKYDLAILSYDRAMAYYSEAEDMAGYFATLKDKGSVYLFRADYAQAMNHYSSALDYYRRNNMLDGLSRCLNNIGIIHKNRGEYLEALNMYDESIQYLDPKEDAMEIAQGFINIGNVFVLLGRYERALEYFRMALEISEMQNSRTDIALCLANSGVIQNKCGNYPEALRLYRRAMQVAETIHDPVQTSNCLINIGTNYADMGQPEIALDYVERGMQIKVELGDERAISNCLIHLAEIYHQMGDYNRAIALFTEAVPEKEKLGDQEGLVRCYLGTGAALMQTERYREAQSLIGRAIESARMIGSIEHLARGYMHRRDIAVTMGDYRSAFEYADLHHHYMDSLMNEATARAVVEMEFRNKSLALEQENENLRIRTTLTEELMKKRSAFLYSIAGLTALLAAGLILVIHFLRKIRSYSHRLEEKNIVITRQNMKLDTMNRNKDRMMSIIAHDLRGTIGNQLTAIEFLHSLDHTENEETDQDTILGNLKNSSAYSLELLENLLHWSRLGEENYNIHPEQVDLNALVNICLTLFSETVKKKQLEVRLISGDPIRCRVDRIMMETIIRNLLSNAIKFSDPGGKITVKMNMEGEMIRFSVEDQGMGMSEEEIRKITEKGGYTRRGTAGEKGAGIGLTLVREFIARHGGNLEISSKPGTGSTLEIVFPCNI